jgi:hypothetical protein
MKEKLLQCKNRTKKKKLKRKRKKKRKSSLSWKVRPRKQKTWGEKEERWKRLGEERKQRRELDSLKE